MNKVKVFNDFYDSFCGINFQNNQPNGSFYIRAILATAVQISEPLSPEDKKKLIEQITFWSIYNYGKGTMLREEPELDIEVENLPINLDAVQFKRFKKAIGIIIYHYENIALFNNKHCPISMNDFEDLFTRTERLTIPIPLIWLGT